MAAQRLGRRNINVNAICPGVTRTEARARNAVERAAERRHRGRAQAARKQASIRRPTPGDIAAMAVFLASPGARGMLGGLPSVDGGGWGRAGRLRHGALVPGGGSEAGAAPTAGARLLLYGWVILACLCCAGFSVGDRPLPPCRSLSSR
jgi:hypothetical protein